jgi:hypothetical protein
MRLYVWQDHNSFLVVAHAANVPDGRRLALQELGAPDGTSTTRKRAIDFVTANNPTIYIGNNAEYALEEEWDGDPKNREIVGITHFS